MSMRDNSQGIENNITLTIPSSYYIMGDGNVHDIQALYYNYLSESEVPLTSFTTTDEVYEEQEPSSSNSDILAVAHPLLISRSNWLPIEYHTGLPVLEKSNMRSPQRSIVFASHGEDAMHSRKSNRSQAVGWSTSPCCSRGSRTWTHTDCFHQQVPGPMDVEVYLYGEKYPRLSREYPKNCAGVILPKVIRPGALVALGPPAMHIYNVITDALGQTAKYDLNWWINTQSPYNNLVQALNVDHQVFCSR